MKVVTNTSPLILLAKINRLELLLELFDEVLIPLSVQMEINAKPGRISEAVETLIRSAAFQARAATRQVVASLPADLGAGERETIALAIESGADLAVIDDREGRRIARRQGLKVTGTIGVLVQAKEHGLIVSLRRELDRLVEAGMWLDEVFYHRLLQEYKD